MGPLLFLIYINDIVSVIKSPALLFADNIKIFCPIVNRQASALQLQQDLLALKEWSMKWLLKFNISKRWSCTWEIQISAIATYYMDEQPLWVVRI